MQRLKVYLDAARTANVACAKCGKSKEVNFSGKDVPHSTLVKCSCGNAFIVNFEQRQYYRKKLDTVGTCFVDANPNQGIHIRIIDVSLTGLQFEKSGGPAFRLNQILRVVFRLDGEVVELIVSVRNITGENIGAEILSSNEHSKKIIGFYLMP